MADATSEDELADDVDEDIVDDSIEDEDPDDTDDDDAGDTGDDAVVPDIDAVLADDDNDDDDDDDDDDESGVDTEALEELEAEELELLEEEVGSELAVDEVEELRNIRREELSMNTGAQERRSDEFQCSVCFMVKRTSQLASPRKLVCNDCAS